MSIFNKPSILDEINAFSNCEIAFFTTYNFDISFFDRSILSALTQNKARICVFADSNKLQEAINDFNYSQNDTGLGRHYFVHSFKMDKTFHPKVILLLGNKKAKLIVSSANLKYSSHYQNNEIFQSFDYNEENTKYLNLFYQAFNFFKELASESKDAYIDELIKYASEKHDFVLKQNNDTDTLLLTSFSESILNQLKRNITEDVKLIRVAVPFYDDELSAVNEFKRIFSNAEMKLYIQDGCSTFPKDKYSSKLIDKVSIFNKVVNNGKNRGEFYHGKLFSFTTNSKEYVLYGSANFSASALLRSYKKGGNIEACILDNGETGCSDELFNSFLTVENINIDQLTTREMENDSNPNNDNLVFIKGHIEDETLRLLIKATVEPKRIAINNKEIDNPVIIDKGNNQYLVCVDYNKVLNKCIFDLTILDSTPLISVRCFVCNVDSLSSFVESTSKNPFKRLKTDEDMEKRKKDVFFEQLGLVIGDVKNAIRDIKIKEASVGIFDVNDDTTEDEEDEDEELDASLYETPDYVLSVDSHEIYQKALGYLNYYTKKVSTILSKKQKKNKEKDTKKTDATTEESEKRERKKQTYIDSVLNSFKKCAKKENELFDGLDFEFYFKMYETFSDEFIRDLYLDRTCKTDTDKLIEIKMDFLINRVLPCIDDDAIASEHFEYFIKEIALMCLESYSKDAFLTTNLKEALMKLDRQLSNTLIEKINYEMRNVGEVLEMRNVGHRIDYFNNFIFDSPDKKQFESAINNHFNFVSSTMRISFDNTISRLTIEIDDIEKKATLTDNLNLTQEMRGNIINFINRFYENEKQDSLSFEITMMNYSNIISEIHFVWDKHKYRQYTRTIAYRERTEPSIRDYNFA